MNDWKQLSDEEVEVMRPFVLDARGLNVQSTERLSQEARQLLEVSIRAFIKTMARLPEQAELDAIAKATVVYLNQNRGPALHAASLAGDSVH